MEVSSSSNTNAATLQVDAMKKSTQVQEQAMAKLLESSDQQSKEITAQKTGVGGNVNLTA